MENKNEENSRKKNKLKLYSNLFVFPCQIYKTKKKIRKKKIIKINLYL